MPQSRVSQRISIRDTITKLNDKECMDVIQLLSQEFGYQDLNSIVADTIFMQFSKTLSMEVLLKMKTQSMISYPILEISKSYLKANVAIISNHQKLAKNIISIAPIATRVNRKSILASQGKIYF